MGESFFYFFMTGVALFIVYDIFRFLRLLFSNTIFSFFADLIWWIITAFCIFTMYLIFYDGKIRTLCLAFSFAGFTFSYFTLGTVTRRIWEKNSSVVRKILRNFSQKLKKCNKNVKKVLHLPTKVLYNKKGLGRKFFKNKKSQPEKT